VSEVSVALATFQGERFLAEQLASIAAQTLPPSELVVCDDGSTDGSLGVLERFAASAPFPVRIHVNEARLGVAGNFARAISLCRGTIIALSDQDDVWAPSKLERLAAALDRHPGAGAAFSDAALVDGSLRPLGRTLFEATRFAPRRRARFESGHALDVVLARPVVCGATLAFRASFRDLVVPIPSTGLHDLWLSTLLSAVTEVVVVPEPLVHYRQHGANQVGAPLPGPWAKLARRRRQGVFGDEVAHHRAMADRLAALPPSPRRDRAVAALNRKVEHLEFRHGPAGRHAVPVLGELLRGRYHRYARGLESAGFDLLLRSRAGG
jgi:glycosyltransferase involved in cell wall biosynthesis